MKKNFAFILILAAVFLSGCDNLGFSKPKKPNKGLEQPAASSQIVKGPIVARLNGMPVTLDELNMEVEMINSLVPPGQESIMIKSREDKRALLQTELVRKTLLYQEALRRGLDKDEEVVQVLEKQKKEALAVQLVRRETEKMEVSDAEVEEYYNNYKNSMKSPEERRVREIMLPTEIEAKDVLSKVMQGEDFGMLAKQYSKAPSASVGGDIGFIKPQEKFEQYNAMVFSSNLEVGKSSGVFQGPDGYYIVKLDDKKGGETPSLSIVGYEIKRLLTLIKQKKKIDELVDRLSKQSQLEIYEGEIR